jgi:hypothetical protein
MSFGNRSNYASLNDAFGIKEFGTLEEKSYTVKEPQQEPATPSEVVKDIIVESFTDNPMEIESGKCSCGCHTSKINIKDWMNEILNIILICILLYIVVFKPKI